MMIEPVAQFIDAMRAAGIQPVEPIADRLMAGEPVRFRTEGDKPGRRNGWAMLHLDRHPAGVFRHYRLGVRVIWRAGVASQQLSVLEKRQILKELKERSELRKQQATAKQVAVADGAKAEWFAAKGAHSDHPYLLRKALPPMGIRQSGNALLIPLVDQDYRLWNLQRIYPDGTKRFLKDGRTQGLFWAHGFRPENHLTDGGILVIGEGFATMAAIHMATGHGVIAALSAGNLLPVARAIRRQFPARQLIVAADDDCHLSDNIGLRAAQAAAEAVGGLLATPRPLSGTVAADVPRARWPGAPHDGQSVRRLGNG